MWQLIWHKLWHNMKNMWSMWNMCFGQYYNSICRFFIHELSMQPSKHWKRHRLKLSVLFFWWIVTHLCSTQHNFQSSASQLEHTFASAPYLCIFQMWQDMKSISHLWSMLLQCVAFYGNVTMLLLVCIMEEGQTLAGRYPIEEH